MRIIATPRFEAWPTRGGSEGWNERMEDAIAAACRLKADVVARDEREGDLRRVLNLGHTLGHAFEAVTKYRRFTHGEAVGWGLIGAAAIARRRGLLPAAQFEEIASGVDRLGARPGLRGLAPERVLDAVARDKKARGGRVPFVLPTAIGAVTIVPDVTTGEILAALDELVQAARLRAPARLRSASGPQRARPGGRDGAAHEQPRTPSGRAGGLHLSKTTDCGPSITSAATSSPRCAAGSA